MAKIILPHLPDDKNNVEKWGIVDNFCTFTPFIFQNLDRIQQEMMQFLGNIEAKIDAKGRVFVPAIFRKRLQSMGEEFLVLRKDIFQDCLVLYPGSVWEKEIETLRNRLSKWNEEERRTFRQFLLDAEQIDFDSNGRILIPKRYSQMVGIESDVRFLGFDDTIEIWAKENLEKPQMSPEDFSKQIQQLMN